jgi:hypothetical protein
VYPEQNLSLLAGFGHRGTLELGFPTLKEEEGKLSRKRRACILGSCQAEMAGLCWLLGWVSWLVGEWGL